MRLRQQAFSSQDVNTHLVVATFVNIHLHALRFQARPRHDLHRALGEVSIGGFAREHHAVRAVQHRVGYIRALCPSGAWVDNHGLEHLSRHDARLASFTAFCNHCLLLAKDLLGRDLHAQIATRHHHAVGHRQNLIELVQGLPRRWSTRATDIIEADALTGH